jgi:hypothetical protein
MTTPITDLDCIFISYDEPNADDHYADLLRKVPWAKRVHGVDGSDAAHKAAALLSETDRFISVDADNIVDIKFFDQEIDFEHPKFKDKVVSWSARNEVNGLEYGNGGLKCWPVKYVLDMKTHEQADPNDPRSQIDFCWEDSYIQMNNKYCVTHNNGSPHQAFRAGFREGVKMTLDSVKGGKVDPDKIKATIWHGNYQRLLVWCSVGRDVENGEWAIYGARLGTYMTNLTDWDYVNVRDFKWLNNFWETEVAPKFASTNPTNTCHRTGYRWHNDLLENESSSIGRQLVKGLNLEIADLDSAASKFFKTTYTGLPRTGTYITESDLEELRKINR